MCSYGCKEGLDVAAVIDALELDLEPIVTAQISQLVNQIAIAVSEITGEPIDQALIDEILASIDIDDIIAQITANVQVSLEILETCLDLTPITSPPPATTETLTVIKNTECQADPQTCQANPIQPSNFTVVIEGNNPSQNNFPGSSGTGTNVALEAGPYNVTEQGLDPVTPAICSTMGFEAGQGVSTGINGDLFICTNFSVECDGDIAIGNPQTCTIENVLVSTPTETLTVIKNVDCQADPATCEQNSIVPSNFTIVIDGNNPSQNNFPGSSGTGTNVELEAGPYNVTEQGLDPVTPAICSDMGFEAGSDLGDDLFICTNFSDECEGEITLGNPQTCIIDNVLIQQQVIGNNVYVVWTDRSNGGDQDIFFRVSNNNGETFGSPIDLSSNTGQSNGAQILVSGNNVYVVWEDLSNGPDADIFFRVSNDNGETFEPPIDLSSNNGDLE